jgi:hypothetical protein
MLSKLRRQHVEPVAHRRTGVAAEPGDRIDCGFIDIQFGAASAVPQAPPGRSDCD